MADRAISELTAVTGVNAEDSFVLQQNNRAMRLTGQVLLNWLAAALDGHGGINTIAKTGTTGLVDTYTITFADESTHTFTVTNGKAISTIAKTGTTGLVDTYTITYNDNTTDTFTVTNGKAISTIAKTGTEGLQDTYTITFNDGSNTTFIVTNGAKGDKGDNTYTFIKYSTNSPAADADMHDTPDNWIGIYYGPLSTAPTSYQSYSWFNIKGEKGNTGDDVTISAATVLYQTSESGTVTPETWQSTIPAVPQGHYLWTRTYVQYSTGQSTTTYSVARMGIDGAGSVSSVMNVSPDANGNVTLPMDATPTANSNNFVRSGGVALINSRHELSFASAYDATVAYDVDDYCIYNNQLYRCISQISMGEAWTPAHWVATSFGAEILAIKQATWGDIEGWE